MTVTDNWIATEICKRCQMNALLIISRMPIVKTSKKSTTQKKDVIDSKNLTESALTDAT